MTIVTPEAPKRSLDALGAILSTLAESAGLKRAAPHFAARIMASSNELRAPGLSYRVYVLSLVDIAARCVAVASVPANRPMTPQAIPAPIRLSLGPPRPVCAAWPAGLRR
jgi:hypothetical protein